ncbi:hypothetical protein Psch_01419 [Pelotomaculum schinkii]|uniref:Uncharacterized protein n=1 Tax=Pelotomaculum schinkii TaxID=78350 RepID=A0A4Y7RFU7_9FIRM|nr:DUF6519 domain-containing protein [Pelotomaculum schinkii]TEB07864.1 hypothetical protein Psch_01419 [Pelotomaculum schinkii]
MGKGNFSRNTFDKLKHYVGVRLQQGVPIVDADWNELEDIRKFELETFLKWFVGDGVPLGNDGFKIEHANEGGNIRLSMSGEFGMQTIITIDHSQSTAADILGFGSANCSAAGNGLSARLSGTAKEPFALRDGTLLVINVKRSPLSSTGKAAWSRTWKVVFQNGAQFKDIGKATAAEVAAAIARAASDLRVSAGLQNDFIIKGGDGTPEGAGRCLVEGWEVINECDLHYTDQQLYENDTLAAALGVDPLLPLTGQKPDQAHSNLYYLDVWERVVDEHEDTDLVNKIIGVPTCVRIKREWVVRGLEGCEKNTVTVPETIRRQGHVYYPLARLDYYQQYGRGFTMLADLRRTGVTIVSQPDLEKITVDVKAIASDAFGADYRLAHTGRSYINTSLREAINAVLRGHMPGMPAQSLAKTNHKKTRPSIVEGNEVMHVCWQENRGSVTADSWCLSFMVYDGNAWNGPTKVGGGNAHPCNPFLLEGDEGVLALWVGDYDRRKRCIFYTKYVDEWKDVGIMIPDILISNEECEVFAIMHNDYLWLFWMDADTESGKNAIWYNRRKPYTTGRDSTDWEGKRKVPGQSAGDPVAIVDGNGNLLVLWLSQDGSPSIRSITCDLKNPSSPSWGQEETHASTQKISGGLSVVKDKTNDIWVFFSSEENFKTSLWYLRIRPDHQGVALVQLTTGQLCSDSTGRAISNREGDIFIIWNKFVGGKISEIWCRCYTSDHGWGQEMQIVPGIFGTGGGISAAVDSWDNIWAVYINNMGSQREISCRKLLPYI